MTVIMMMTMMMITSKSLWRLGKPACICQVANQFNQDYPPQPIIIVILIIIKSLLIIMIIIVSMMIIMNYMIIMILMNIMILMTIKILMMRLILVILMIPRLFATFGLFLKI